jgi:hypothetical protein
MCRRIGGLADSHLGLGFDLGHSSAQALEFLGQAFLVDEATVRGDLPESCLVAARRGGPSNCRDLVVIDAEIRRPVWRVSRSSRSAGVQRPTPPRNPAIVAPALRCPATSVPPLRTSPGTVWQRRARWPLRS